MIRARDPDEFEPVSISSMRRFERFQQALMWAE
jgi:hypothetical protein